MVNSDSESFEKTTWLESEKNSTWEPADQLFGAADEEFVWFKQGDRSSGQKSDVLPATVVNEIPYGAAKEEAKINKAIVDLADDDFEKRSAATAVLNKAGVRAIPLIIKMQRKIQQDIEDKKPVDLELKQRLYDIMNSHLSRLENTPWTQFRERFRATSISKDNLPSALKALDECTTFSNNAAHRHQRQDLLAHLKNAVWDDNSKLRLTHVQEELRDPDRATANCRLALAKSLLEIDKVASQNQILVALKANRTLAKDPELIKLAKMSGAMDSPVFLAEWRKIAGASQELNRDTGKGKEAADLSTLSADVRASASVAITDLRSSSDRPSANLAIALNQAAEAGCLNKFIEAFNAELKTTGVKLKVEPVNGTKDFGMTVVLKSSDRQGDERPVQIVDKLIERPKVREEQLNFLRVLPEGIETFTRHGDSAKQSSHNRKDGITLLESQRGTEELVRGLRSIDSACDILNTKSPTVAAKAIDTLLSLEQKGSQFAKKYLQELREKVGGQKQFDILVGKLNQADGLVDALKALATVKAGLTAASNDFASLRTRSIVQSWETAGIEQLSEMKQKLIDEVKHGNNSAALELKQVETQLVIREIETAGSVESVKKLYALATAGNEHSRAALTALIVPPGRALAWQEMSRLSDHPFRARALPDLKSLSETARQDIQVSALTALRTLAESKEGLSHAECSALALSLGSAVAEKNDKIVTSIKTLFGDVSERAADSDPASARRTEALLIGLFNAITKSSEPHNSTGLKELMLQYAMTVANPNNRVTGGKYDTIGESLKSHFAEFQSRGARGDKTAIEILAYFAGGVGRTNCSINPLVSVPFPELPKASDRAMGEASKSLLEFAEKSVANKDFVISILTSRHQVEIFKDQGRKLQILGLLASRDRGEISEKVRETLRTGLKDKESQISALKGLLVLGERLNTEDFQAIAQNLSAETVEYFRKSVLLSPAQEKQLSDQILSRYRSRVLADNNGASREIALHKRMGSLCEAMGLLRSAYSNYDKASRLQETTYNPGDKDLAETHDKAARLAERNGDIEAAKRHNYEAGEIRRVATYLEMLKQVRDDPGKAFAVFSKLPNGIKLDVNGSLTLSSDSFHTMLEAIPSLRLASGDSLKIGAVTFDGEKLKINGEARYSVRSGGLDLILNIKEMSCDLKVDPKDKNRIVISNIQGFSVEAANMKLAPGTVKFSLVEHNGKLSLSIEPTVQSPVGNNILGNLIGQGLTAAAKFRTLEIPLRDEKAARKMFENIREGLAKKDASKLAVNLAELFVEPSIASIIQNVKSVQKSGDRLTVTSEAAKRSLGGVPVEWDKTVRARVTSDGNELKITDVQGARLSLPIPPNLAGALRISNPLKIDFKEMVLSEPDRHWNVWGLWPDGNRTAVIRAKGVVELVSFKIGPDMTPVIDQDGNTTVDFLVNKGAKLPFELKFNPKQPIDDPAKIDFKLTVRENQSEKFPDVVAAFLKSPLDPVLKEALKGVKSIEKKGDLILISRDNSSELSSHGFTVGIAKEVSFNIVSDKNGVSVTNISGIEVRSLPGGANLIYARTLPIVLNSFKLSNPDNAGVRILTIDSSGPLRGVVMELNPKLTPVDICVELENPVQALKNLMQRCQKPAWDLLGRKMAGVETCRIHIKNNTVDMGLLKDIGSMFSDAGDLLSPEGAGLAAIGIASETLTNPFSFKAHRRVLANTLKGLGLR